MTAKVDPKKFNRILSIIALTMLAFFLLFSKNMFDSAYVQRVLSLCAIYAICALSMNIVNGFTGLFSLGQAGFMAIGAYVTALLVISPELKTSLFYLEPIVPWLANVQLPILVAVILGGVLAAIAAALIGFPVLRLRGDYLAIATLGFSEIIRVIITNIQSVTNGALGIKSIPAPNASFVALAKKAPESIRAPLRFFADNFTILLVFLVLAIVSAFLLRLMNTTYGRAIKSIREDEIAAQAMGVNLFKHKMYALILSGFIGGVGGGLIASQVGSIDPSFFRYTLSYDILLMVVLGGQGSISGSIAGAFIVVTGKEALRFIDQPINLGFIQYPGISGMRMVVFSLLLMLVILFWSRGIFGQKEFSWQGLIGLFKKLFSPKKRGDTQ